jgi:hypothetical protein
VAVEIQSHPGKVDHADCISPGPTARPETPTHAPRGGGLHETEEGMSLQHPGTAAMQSKRPPPAESQNRHPSTSQSPPPNSPPPAPP